MGRLGERTRVSKGEGCRGLKVCECTREEEGQRRKRGKVRKGGKGGSGTESEVDEASEGREGSEECKKQAKQAKSKRASEVIQKRQDNTGKRYQQRSIAFFNTMRASNLICVGCGCSLPRASSRRQEWNL
jgi:hypothetical protein